MRPELEAVLRDLLARGAGAVSLDDIGDAIGTIGVGVEDVEELFAALERHGRVIAEPDSSSLAATLAVVLAAARDLRRERGTVPSPPEIAARAGLPLAAVRRALLFASVVQR
jgi:hypothetical protein